MTTLVSLLFNAMIPIDCKITNNFSLHLFVYFFGKNYNIGELTSATSKERMTKNIILEGATFIKKSSCASKLCIFVCFPRCTALYIVKGKHEKYLFLPLYGNTEIHCDSTHACPPGSISHSEKAKGRLCFVFRVV